MYEIRITLPIDARGAVKRGLDSTYGAAWRIDTANAEKSGSWGEVEKGVMVYQLNGLGTVVVFQDNTKKTFNPVICSKAY